MTNANYGPANQWGASKLGMLLLVFFIAAFLTLGLKVGPLYMDNSMVINLADDMVEDGSADALDPSQIRLQFANALRLNSIYDFELSDIEISRNRGKTAIRIAYERRVPMFANLDVVVAFDHISQ
ncbi:MAG: DUF4845 domain-containing protein [Gammaproteobacteria bacterium]|nr:DUF4845 domain-containing protein [Gammaproteobacteria bacterium]